MDNYMIINVQNKARSAPKSFPFYRAKRETQHIHVRFRASRLYKVYM